MVYNLDASFAWRDVGGYPYLYVATTINSATITT